MLKHSVSHAVFNWSHVLIHENTGVTRPSQSGGRICSARRICSALLIMPAVCLHAESDVAAAAIIEEYAASHCACDMSWR